MKLQASFLGLLFTLVFALSEQCHGQCIVIQDEVETYLYTQDDFGQSFIPCQSGILTELDIMSHHFLNGSIDVILSIFEGEGYTGALLYTRSVTLSDEWGGVFNHLLEEEVQVMTGLSYTYKLDFQGEYGLMWAEFQEAYPDGQVYWNGAAQSNMDMGFNAYITPGAAPACITWTGQAGSDWDDPQNWMPEQVPDSTDCVIVDVVDSDEYPTIDGVARTHTLSIAPGAMLEQTEDGQLDIYGSLHAEGQTVFGGSTRLISADAQTEITGSPVFDRLKIEGVFFTTETIEILDLLDLTDGYLANFGTEVIVHTGAGNQGHVYMPGDVIVGHVIIQKHIATSGDQLIGLPFTASAPVSITCGTEQLLADTFFHQFDIDQFAMNWSGTDLSQTAGPVEVIKVSCSEEDELTLQGEVTNEEVLVFGETNEVMDAGGLKLVSNPYPSVIDLDGLILSPGASKAMYAWSPEKQQYGARIDGFSIHEMGDRLYPTEAVMVQLQEEHQVKFIYEHTVVPPLELDLVTGVVNGPDHLLQLKVTTSAGSDELLLRLVEGASLGFDTELDALKIPSLNSNVPTIGIPEESGSILSINTIPHPASGAIIPMYFNAGTVGPLTFDPIMLDLGEEYDRVFIYDAENGIFHDLLTQGSYQTIAGEDDGLYRFKLVLGLEDEIAQDYALESLPVVNEVDNGPFLETPFSENNAPALPVWHIASIESAVLVAPVTSVDPTMVSRVAIHSLEGKLVFDRSLIIPEGGWEHPLYVSPGIYSVSVTQGDHRSVKKVWLD